MNRKKIITLTLALTMLFTLGACGNGTAAAGAGSAEPAKTQTPVQTQDIPQEQTSVQETVPAQEPPAEKTELIVFAAASLTESLDAIIADYRTAAPNVTITPNYDSSGTLKTQIENGADVDIFISAGQKQMNQLDITASTEVNTDGLDFVLEGTRIDLLENKVALVVPEGNPKDINSFDDLVAGLQDGSVMLAMGNSDVPVGQYTQNIFAYCGLDEEALANSGVLTYGSNVKEVTTQVSEATVDAGIIYASDAYSAGLTVVALATSEMTGGRVVYPAAVMNVTKNEAAARAFLDFLTGPAASAEFAAVLFTPLS